MYPDHCICLRHGGKATEREYGSSCDSGIWICKRITDSTDPRCDLHCARKKQTGWGWNLRSIPDHKDQNGIKDQVAADLYKNLCGVQVQQFRKKYGIIENVSDREYVSNSFHCHVTEEITPIEKQDLEGRFWNLSNGGKIQYVKYPISYNVDAIKSLVRRAMAKGYYEGVNLSLSYCDDCGHEELDMDVCPECGSTNLTKIERMNGYLSYSRVKGDTRLNDAKMAEIAERKSM